MKISLTIDFSMEKTSQTDILNYLEFIRRHMTKRWEETHNRKWVDGGVTFTAMKAENSKEGITFTV